MIKKRNNNFKYCSRRGGLIEKVPLIIDFNKGQCYKEYVDSIYLLSSSR